jgi:ribosomal protein S18 acetylase RimI-like enzyme
MIARTSQDRRVVALAGRAEVVRATGRHAYARFAVGRAIEVRGVCADRAVLWFGRNRHGLVGHGLGDESTLDELLAGIRLPEPAQWINLPRRSDLPPGYRLNEHWDFRWLTGAVPPPPGPDRVVPLSTSDFDAIDGLLDLALPASVVRPGMAHVHGWYGIWWQDTLVACAADRSNDGPDEPVGVLGGIAVHPAHRGRGLGAAVTAELTRRLLHTYDLVTLGVAAGNTAASRLYHRLGYTHRHAVTSVRR